MSKLPFYLRMAAQNLRKNGLFTLPYALTGTACVAMYYIMEFLRGNDRILESGGGVYLQTMLGLGTVIMFVLIVWIMVYANTFVRKRRRKELALYNILGMEKRQVALLLGVETLYLAAACIGAGIALGALFSKLVLMLMLRAVRVEIPLGLRFSAVGARNTAVLFAVLFGLLLLGNLRELRHISPAELLASANAGEREPKSRRLLAVIGVLTLGAGYALAFFIREPLLILFLFFVAVALVIVGTHCLFGSATVLALKALRANKNYYYKPGHFTAVSGLIYRMNQNARGLANICILSTTVLVCVGTTVSLYATTEGSMQTLYPHELYLYTELEQQQLAEPEGQSALITAARQAAAEYGVAPETVQGGTRAVGFAQYSAAGEYKFVRSAFASTELQYCQLSLITAADYTALTGQPVTVNPGSVLAWNAPEGWSALDPGDGGAPLQIAGTLTEYPRMSDTDLGNSAAILPPCGYVVADAAALQRLCAAYGAGSGMLFYTVQLDAGGTPEQRLACADAVQTACAALAPDCRTVSRQRMSDEYYTMYGSFLFVGVFLAVLFLMATVLIIYYKQISEGYEDRDRFVILQRVGMSESEVRRTIGTQVRLVFLLPLVTAAIHTAAASPMLIRLIEVFAPTNLWVYAGVTAATLAVFAVCYFAIYTITARRYYKIVRCQTI